MIDFEAANKLKDEELVALALGNQDYFIFIINRYKEKLFNYIRRITNAGKEDAEDLLQEIFLKVYLNLNDFDTGFKFSSWIYSITRNHVISHHRKLKARAEGHSSTIDDEMAQNIVSNLDLEKEINLKFLKENIFKILGGMNEKYREVLVLKFLEEKSYEEISDILKRPIGTVGSMINTAKKEFKKELEKQKIKL